MLQRFTVRLGSQDLMVFQEVLIENEYRLPDIFDKDDIVLDVGAHIGCFAVACLARGAGRVISYEPEPENFELLTHNAPQAEHHQLALWESGKKEVGLASAGEPYTAMGHCVLGLGAPVGAVTLGDMIAPHPRVRLLKLDCEGGEWPGLFQVALALLGRVDEIVGELHHKMKRPEWPLAWDQDTLAGFLERQGFGVEVVPGRHPDTTSHFFARRGR